MTTFLFIGVSIGMFSALLALSKRPNQISDKIFSIFLLSLSLPILFSPFQEYFGKYQLIYASQLGVFIPLTLGPFMVLYLESLTKPNYELSTNWIYHFLPFFIFSIVASSYHQSSFFGTPNKSLLDETMTLVASSPWLIANAITLLLSLISYSIWLQLSLKKHRKKVLDYYAHNTNNISLKWLTWVVYFIFITFSFPHLIDSLVMLNILSPDPDLIEHNHTFKRASFVIFICVLSFFGVRQSQVFIETFDSADEKAEEDKLTEREEVIEKIDSTNKIESKNRPSVINEDQLQNYLKALESYVKTEKPYHESELTLGGLATLLNMPKHHLTETLNRKLHKNFYSYINDYRLEEIKQLLADPNNSSQTVLKLAYQVGFNSKSTFNSFFKKSTTMTPSQFRKASLAVIKEQQNL